MGDFLREKEAVTGLKHFRDERGELVEVDFERGLPFAPRRLFYIFDVPAGTWRGGHAHRECRQFLICLKGSVTVETDDGEERRDYLLDNPHAGLYLPPPVWCSLGGFSQDAVLMVLASHPYDAADYIRDRQEFICYVKAL